MDSNNHATAVYVCVLLNYAVAVLFTIAHATLGTEIPDAPPIQVIQAEQAMIGLLISAWLAKRKIVAPPIAAAAAPVVGAFLLLILLSSPAIADPTAWGPASSASAAILPLAALAFILALVFLNLERTRATMRRIAFAALAAAGLAACSFSPSKDVIDALSKDKADACGGAQYSGLAGGYFGRANTAGTTLKISPTGCELSVPAVATPQPTAIIAPRNQFEMLKPQ